MKKELFSNGVEIARVDNNKYFIESEDGEYIKQVDKKEFIEYLKKISYSCLTSWNKEIRQQYLELVDIVKEMK